jgi:eukaryotic-like serine/threonine-protein kinase
VNLWLRAIRDDILKLSLMPVDQFLGQDGLSLLDNIATLANDAFVGTINTDDQVTPGVVQINYAIQRLATFDIRACSASNPCSIT